MVHLNPITARQSYERLGQKQNHTHITHAVAYVGEFCTYGELSIQRVTYSAHQNILKSSGSSDELLLDYHFDKYVRLLVCIFVCL